MTYKCEYCGKKMKITDELCTSCGARNPYYEPNNKTQSKQQTTHNNVDKTTSTKIILAVVIFGLAAVSMCITPIIFGITTIVGNFVQNNIVQTASEPSYSSEYSDNTDEQIESDYWDIRYQYDKFSILLARELTDTEKEIEQELSGEELIAEPDIVAKLIMYFFPDCLGVEVYPDAYSDGVLYIMLDENKDDGENTILRYDVYKSETTGKTHHFLHVKDENNRAIYKLDVDTDGTLNR